MKMPRAIGLSLALLVVPAAAMAKEAHSGHHHHHPGPSVKSKSVKGESAGSKAHGRWHRVRRTVARATHRHDRLAPRELARNAPPDQYIGPLRVIGRREVGSAAWYGRWHVGRKTASGERLDRVHVTAAHRTLPLHSLVQVTNLTNGRSIVATINDRGPVSRSLLIDLSPRAADELHMKDAGIVKVAIVPVAPAAQPPH